MAVPLTILDTTFMDESSFERDQLLVDLTDSLDNLFKSLLWEPRFIMGKFAFINFRLLFLLGPSRVPANSRLEDTIGTSFRSGDVCIHVLEPGLVRTFAFLAEDTLDLANSASDVSSEDPFTDNMLDDAFQSLLSLELLFIKSRAGRLDFLDRLLEIAEVYIQSRVRSNRFNPI